MRRLVVTLVALCAVLCAAAFANAATCTLNWQTPAQGAITQVNGSATFTLGISCPAGVNPQNFNYQVWGGCYDSNGALPAGYTNTYTQTGGPISASNSCVTSPLAGSGPNGGQQVPVIVNYNTSTNSGTVSFQYDFTKAFPQSSVEDINFSSMYDSAIGDFDATTPRNCAPNNDCDTVLEVGPPASSPPCQFTCTVQGSNFVCPRPACL